MRPIAAGGLALAAAGLSAAAWAMLVEPRWLEVTRHEVELPNLPPSSAGRLVGFISDLQIGVLGANVGTIRRAVDRLIAARAAVALLGGDYLSASTGTPRRRPTSRGARRAGSTGTANAATGSTSTAASASAACRCASAAGQS